MNKNGGKPHICGEIAVHNNSRKDTVHLCTKCGLPVDQPTMKEIKNEEIEDLQAFCEEYIKPAYWEGGTAEDYDFVKKAIIQRFKEALTTKDREIKKIVEGLRKDTRVTDVCIIDDCPCPESKEAQGYNQALDDVLKRLKLNRGAEDFRERFGEVMKELAED
jgi:hypothetical protein